MFELNSSKEFNEGLKKLGFDSEKGKNLFLVTDINDPQINPSIYFHLEKAKRFGATAVFFRTILNNQQIAQIYIYDYTSINAPESDLSIIHKKIWSSGEVPLVCIFTKTEIKILNCTQPIDAKLETPNYLINDLELVNEASDLYKQFANNIKSGVFWEQDENKDKFNFDKSAYKKLIEFLRKVIKDFTTKSGLEEKVAHKLIVQSILIKYLEEREDEDAKGSKTKVFSNDFFNKYKGAKSFCDVLRNGNCLNLFDDLNKEEGKEGQFNGKIFGWDNYSERIIIEKTNLKDLADALDATINFDRQGNLFDWRQYDFKFIPVELISRLYEEFLVNIDSNENNNTKGIVYTPSHLAKLLVDESMPIDEPQNTDTFKILDPACGSGIFLVIAYKRLVQWWRINHNMEKPSLNQLKEL